MPDGKKVKQVAIVVFLGIIAALVLLEVGLRVLGMIYTTATTPPEEEVITGRKDHYNVLCTGASWTAGCGAPAGQDYPSHLERILNKKIPGKTFTVFRRAVVSQNTSQVLARLERDIEDTQPDLVVVQVGVANGWNHWGFLAYKSMEESVLTRSADSLETIRAYRLTKILASDIADKFRRAASAREAYGVQRELEQEQFAGIKQEIEKDPRNGRLYYRAGEHFYRSRDGDKAAKYFSEGIEMDPGEVSNYVGMGAVSMMRGDFSEAQEWYRKGIGKAPFDDRCYAGMGWAHYRQGEFAEAVEWYEKALELNPRGHGDWTWYGGYITLSHAYEMLGMTDKALEAAARSLAPKDGLARHRKRMSQLYESREIREWIKTDYREMVKTCGEKGIDVILQTFPNDAYDKYEIGINRAVREVAAELGVPFVDQMALFDEYFMDPGKDRNEYFEFSSDDRYHVTGEAHCNGKGYRLMAENIFNKIREEGFFEKGR